MEPLKLIALDQDDIAIVSTHLQDAVVKVADIVWLPAEKRLVIGREPVRLGSLRLEVPLLQAAPHRAALRAGECVPLPQCRPEEKEAVLNLLAVEFDETDTPAGAVTLIFSGGAALRLEVECLECELADLGPTWTAKARPSP